MEPLLLPHTMSFMETVTSLSGPMTATANITRYTVQAAMNTSPISI